MRISFFSSLRRVSLITPYVSRFTFHVSRFTHRASRNTQHAIRNTPQSQRGIALIIVMVSIFVLAILAGGFAYSMRVETTLARNANSETELEWLGRSGVEYARWILAQQLNIREEPYDALNQVWAGGQGGLGTTNSPLAEVQREVHLGHGSFTWKITDLERKFNLNAPEPVLQQILPQALLALGVDAGEQTPIVNSILNWTASGGNTHHLQGAESDFYQGLKPPYEAKNGPIDDLSELLLIRGITQEMYWGTASTNHTPGKFQAQLNRFGAPVAPPTYSVGLVDLLTPLARGDRNGRYSINLNTASAEVLQLIPGVDPMIAQAICSARDGEDDGSGLLGPYRTVQQVSRVPEVGQVGPIFGAIQQFCSVSSSTFEVQVDAQIGAYKRQFIAILGRTSPRDVQILNFYWK